MKHIAILLFALAAAPTAAKAQTPEKTVSITVENTWDKAKTDEPVVIRLADLKPGFEVRSATVYRGAEEIPSQLDDLNRDTQADELAFVADIPAGVKSAGDPRWH